MSPEAVDRAVGHVQGHDAPATAVFHDQVERKILDEELCVVLQGLLIEGVQDRVTGPVGSRTGPLGRAFAVVGRHAAEGALVDLAFFGTREGHALMFQLDDRGDGLAHHVFDGILVAQPVRPLDGVVHVPAPVVLAHIAERGRNAALGGHGV